VKRLRTYLLFLVPLTFLLGTWWGLRQAEIRIALRDSPPRDNLRVLAFRDLLDRAELSAFSRETRVEVELVEARDERDLLRQALNLRGDFDVVAYLSFQQNTLKQSNVLKTLDPELFPVFEELSPDFFNLDKQDVRKVGVPYLWTLAAFLIQGDRIPPSVDSIGEIIELKESRGRIGLLDSPTEVLSLLVRLGLVVDDWIETDQLNQLVDAAKGLIDKTTLRYPRRPEELDSELWVQQAPIGVIQSALATTPQRGRLLLPRERTSLWVYYLGIAETSKRVRKAGDLIRFLTERKQVARASRRSLLANPLRTLDDSDLPDFLKARFVRELPVSRMEPVFASKSDQTVWLKTLRKLAPQTFGELSREEVAEIDPAAEDKDAPTEVESFDTEIPLSQAPAAPIMAQPHRTAPVHSPLTPSAGESPSKPTKTPNHPGPKAPSGGACSGGCFPGGLAIATAPGQFTALKYATGSRARIGSIDPTGARTLGALNVRRRDLKLRHRVLVT
jgi:spermidine/putrescine-binding protein